MMSARRGFVFGLHASGAETLAETLAEGGVANVPLVRQSGLERRRPSTRPLRVPREQLYLG
jgi:hypothetical protein